MFAEVNNWRPGGLLVAPDAMFWLHRTDIVNRAAKSRLPAVYWAAEYTEVGGLMSYAPSLADMAQRGSVFVDKILRGGSTGRSAGRAGNEVRTDHQPQDRQGPRPDDPAVAAAAGGSGDRVIFPY